MRKRARTLGLGFGRALLMASLTALPGCASHTEPPKTAEPAAPDCTDFWRRMSETLPGTWQAPLDNGKTLTERFSLVSNQSALIEEFVLPSGKQTISVYHPEQRSL